MPDRSTKSPSARPSRLAEVAELAAVSPATVSRVFNAPHLVGAETLKRVTEVAERLNYAPDGVAASLRRHRSLVVGAVMPSLRHAYFASTVEGLQSELAGSGYTLLLGVSQFDDQAELGAVRSMIRQGVDGLVIVGRRHDPALLPLIADSGKPYVLTWSYDAELPSVGVDHRKAMQAAVDHLLDLGHRDFAALMAFPSIDREQERIAGITDALSRRGLSFTPDRLIDAGGSSLQNGRNAFRSARARYPSATAIVCTNDLLAAGVLMECSAGGIAVPRDLSVVGYGDLDVAAALNPPMTTVRVPSEEMGRIAARSLVSRLNGKDDLLHIEIATELVVRSSSGPAPLPQQR
ncbi:LacI family DNA-binding transcriptional regulator [Rhodopseudomonas sp. B29]|uniref:LacI family DNA-binding transcriptional regulator n=1 Tax=Rhodopseudomonas sp. B29 TaxID=95607 RepID=UPI0003B7891D|nr:substrate-binding domain-containing protein [Rhodopseudomonas sp. B29]